MQMADFEALQKTPANQGHLLGQHEQFHEAFTQSVSSLVQQQVEQQTQLSQLVNTVKDLTTNSNC